MAKVIQIEIPDWIDEKEIKRLVEKYIEQKKEGIADILEKYAVKVDEDVLKEFLEERR